MKPYPVLICCCSLLLASCTGSNELNLTCSGKENRESGPHREWSKKFAVDLKKGKLIGYDSEWRDVGDDSEPTAYVEIDESFIKIYDSLNGSDPSRFKVVVISRQTGELVVSDLPENKISISGKCSGGHSGGTP